MKEIGTLIDKVLLIGISLLDDKESLIEQIQVYGPIIKVDAKGIVIKRNGTGSEFVIPPDFEHINEAKPGEYRLRSSGEVVIDPDYISSWTVNDASPESVDSYSKNGFSGYVQQ